MEGVGILRHDRVPGAEYRCLGNQVVHAQNNHVLGEVFKQISVNRVGSE
jgi:hypothetical protein